MALGPKLSFIKAGDVLVADTVMQNFQAIVDFLRAIPANNLLQYKYTATVQTTFGAVGVATLIESGYSKINAGGSPFALEMTASIDSVALGPFAAGSTVDIFWEKCTPSLGSGPVAADVWTPLSPNISFTAANTTAAFLVPSGSGIRYCQTQIINNNVVSLSDGDWVRAIVITNGAAAINSADVQLIVKNPLRS
ncbi:MAG: hypothetical protein ACRCWC_02315 [Plesiomonas shigelloides]